MATIPVSNPQLPFLGAIPGGLRGGNKMIRIKGFMFPDADRLSINFQEGPEMDAEMEPLSDVCLHIDVRPCENDIVRNHCGPEGWGYEERSGFCPIVPGTPFEILVLGQLDCYKIAINGQHYAEFNHRMALEKVNFIYICRDANIELISLELDGPSY